jgi:hypothetical protein
MPEKKERTSTVRTTETGLQNSRPNIVIAMELWTTKTELLSCQLQPDEMLRPISMRRCIFSSTKSG